MWGDQIEKLFSPCLPQRGGFEAKGETDLLQRSHPNEEKRPIAFRLAFLAAPFAQLLLL